MLLLHGFPEFWWTWRHQLVTLAEAGYRAVAVDLRGYGGSDKPPRGYDLITAAADAAGLIRALGEANATVVGHDWGGLAAWTLAAYFPKAVRRLAVVSMAHPLRMRAARAVEPAADHAGAVGRADGQCGEARRLPARLPAADVPGTAAGARRRRAGRVDPVVLVGARLAGRGNRPGLPAAPCASRRSRTPRWSTTAGSCAPPSGPTACGTPGRCGRRSPRPSLHLHGALDPCVPPQTARGAGRYVEAPYRWKVIDGAGHFPHEERPEPFDAELLGWLADPEPDR